MAIPDGVGDTLRKALAVPTDTMITLDIPLLLTKLSQVPAGSDGGPLAATPVPERPDDVGA